MTPAKQGTTRLTRIERLLAAGSLMVLIGLLIGLPALLLMIAGVPFVHGLPSWTQLLDAVRRPDDGQLLVDVLLILAWTGWAAFAVTVATETLALARHRVTPTLHGLGGMQPYVGRLLASVALLLPAGTAITLAVGGAIRWP